MEDVTVQPDWNGAEEALGIARDNVYSDPVSVVLHVQRLEGLLGEVEAYPETEGDWTRLMNAINYVETVGTGDVDFDNLSAALDEVEAAYANIATSIRDSE